MTTASPRQRPSRPFSALWLAALAVAVSLPTTLDGHGVAAWRLLWRLTAAPQDQGGSTRRRVVYTVGDRDRRADLYIPDAPAVRMAAMVLVPGAVRRGNRDPRFVAFARLLARARFVVLAPDMASLHSLQLGPAQTAEVADAVTWLHGRRPRPGVPAIDRIGITGISYGAGPAILAALRPSIGREVAFIVAIGGYFQLAVSLRYMTTGHYRAPGDPPDAPWRRRRPRSDMIWRFIFHNAVHIRRPRDQLALMALAQARLRNPKARIDVFLGKAGGDARAAAAFAANRDPSQVAALLGRLPETLRRRLAAMDLSRRNLSGLRPRLLLIHGLDDPVVPARESLRLAQAAPVGRARVYLLKSLFHVRVGRPGFREAVTFWRAIRDVLRARDGW